MLCFKLSCGSKVFLIRTCTDPRYYRIVDMEVVVRDKNKLFKCCEFVFKAEDTVIKFNILGWKGFCRIDRTLRRCKPGWLGLLVPL